MRNRTPVLAVAPLVLAAAAAPAQDAAPVLRLSTGRADALCIGVTADTTGWVAVGLGSRKMHSAFPRESAPSRRGACCRWP